MSGNIIIHPQNLHYILCTSNAYIYYIQLEKGTFEDIIRLKKKLKNL